MFMNLGILWFSPKTCLYELLQKLLYFLPFNILFNSKVEKKKKTESQHVYCHLLLLDCGTYFIFIFLFFLLNTDFSKLFQYVDHNVTINACAGLNGMKLGGELLTVVQAMPDALPSVT